MATLYRANGITREVHPANGEYFTLNELQDHVGGTVENMPITYPERVEKGIDYLCNENGLAEMLQHNQYITVVLGYICLGDILEVKHEEWS